MMVPVVEAIHPALAAAAAATGKPIPTHAEGMSATSWGVWTLVVIAVPVLPLLVTGMFKIIPAMRKLANDRENSIDDERRADMDQMRKELAEIRKSVFDANERAHRAEIKLATAVAALQLATSELARLLPEDSPVLKQVRELIAAATTDDMGFHRALSRIPNEIANRR